jgi:hypothetical protein
MGIAAAISLKTRGVDCECARQVVAHGLCAPLREDLELFRVLGIRMANKDEGATRSRGSVRALPTLARVSRALGWMSAVL